MEHVEALAILETLLFVADAPLSPDQVSGIFGDRDADEVRAMVQVLNGRYGSEGSALHIAEVGGGFRLTTRPEMAEWVQRLNRVRPARLSRAALETLAVIAYRQPLTKAEVEGVRGVSADGVLRTLLERELIRIVGRKPEAGRPILYGTTRTFLEHFGFKDLTDLPTLREIEELLAEGEARRAGTREGETPGDGGDEAAAGAVPEAGGGPPDPAGPGAQTAAPPQARPSDG